MRPLGPGLFAKLMSLKPKEGSIADSLLRIVVVSGIITMSLIEEKLAKLKILNVNWRPGMKKK